MATITMSKTIVNNDRATKLVDNVEPQSLALSAVTRERPIQLRFDFLFSFLLPTLTL